MADTYTSTRCKRGHATRYASTGACVECARIRARPRCRIKAKAWKAANKQKVLEAKRRDRLRNADTARAYRQRPDVKAKDRARGKARAQTPERIAARRARCEELERARAQRTADKAAQKAAKRLSPEEVKRRRTVHHKRKRAVRRAVIRQCARIEHVSTAALDVLLARQLGGCAYCGRDDSLHLDHMYPLALGGLHVIGNLQWLCAICNMRKRTTPDQVYRKLHGIPPIAYRLRALLLHM